MEKENLVNEYRDKCLELVCQHFQIPLFDFNSGINNVSGVYGDFVSFEELVSLMIVLRLKGHLFCGVIGNSLKSIFECLLKPSAIEGLKAMELNGVSDFIKLKEFSREDYDKVVNIFEYFDNVEILVKIAQDQEKSEQESVFWKCLDFINNNEELRNLRKNL